VSTCTIVVVLGIGFFIVVSHVVLFSLFLLLLVLFAMRMVHWLDVLVLLKGRVVCGLD